MLVLVLLRKMHMNKQEDWSRRCECILSPAGSTGIANIYEVCTHLRGEAGARQVEGAKIGMTHVIGLGTACSIHILEKTS